jgi:hypothetical protein
MAIDWLEQVRDAYDGSTSPISTPTGVLILTTALRAFRNEHAAGSKYLSDEYKSRSRLFVPRTRTIIRKNEAAGAAMLFQ